MRTGCISEHTFETYILAGGRSSRFGEDKALYRYKGRPLILHAIELAAGFTHSITVVAERPDKCSPLGIRTIVDHVLNEGPLRGLQTALQDKLQQSGSGWIWLLPTDLIALDKQAFATLFQSAHALETQPQALVYSCANSSTSAATSRIFANGTLKRFEPLPGFYHTDLLPKLEQQLNLGIRSFQRLLCEVPVHSVSIRSTSLLWQQANFKADLPDL